MVVLEKTTTRENARTSYVFSIYYERLVVYKMVIINGKVIHCEKMTTEDVEICC